MQLAQKWPVIYIHYDLETNKAPHISLWYDYADPEAMALRHSGITALPTTLIVNRHYHIEKAICGPIEHNAICEELNSGVFL